MSFLVETEYKIYMIDTVDITDQTDAFSSCLNIFVLSLESKMVIMSTLI